MERSLWGKLGRPVIVQQGTTKDYALHSYLSVFGPHFGKIELIEPLREEARLVLYMHGRREFEGPFTRDNLHLIISRIRQGTKR